MAVTSAKRTFNLKNKKVTVIGVQKSGIALARLVNHLGGRVKISEQSSDAHLPSLFKEWAHERNIPLEFNGHTQKFIEDSELLVLSPGVCFKANPVRWALEKGIPVLGEIEFAFQFCSAPVIAVTGSNGKTTTVTLIRDLLRKAGFKSCLCGNVGSPFSEHVLNPNYDFFVLETSSFQLESLLETNSPWRNSSVSDFYFKGFKPLISIILNISENHLDRHADMEEYSQAKKRIFLNQDKDDHAILNGEDAWMRKISLEIKPRVAFFNTPEDIKINEMSNPNYLAVLEVARILRIDIRLCKEVFAESKGVEHRLEWVRAIDGVDFINDSKATTAEATRWALNRLDRPIFMICGGRDKHIDFTTLRELVQSKVKKMFVIGEAKEKLRLSFQDIVDLEECENLEEAVFKARKSARKGDCVLLSPMCTSFDMFANFEERGKVFKEIVNKLT